MFPPTLAEARARIEAVRPGDYARTRNALAGAVTGLSPYITHGFVDLVEVATGVAAKHRLNKEHRFVFELGWREFFRHVWGSHGEAIFESIHAGPLPDDAYGRDLPDDVRQARTGVPVIDTAVRTLYDTGYLHNHARMWLASYVVHLRRIHWRAGADWMYAHLVDGDLASNHLSWQWVAGTFSSRPYLFNADNVARFAPERWHSPGSVIDTSYEVLEGIASGGRLPPHRPAGEGVPEPDLFRGPNDPTWAGRADGSAVLDRNVWLIHPWALCDPPNDLPADALVVAICPKEFHDRWAWNALRWTFVGARMRQLSTVCWHDSVAAIVSALQGARSVRGFDDAHLPDSLRKPAFMHAPRRLFSEVLQPCSSFSHWWKRARLNEGIELLANTTTEHE